MKNMYHALIALGKLQIRFNGEEIISRELINLQKFLAEKDHVNSAVSIGRFEELATFYSIDGEEEIKILKEYVCNSNFNTRNPAEKREKKERKDISIERTAAYMWPEIKKF